MDSRLLVVTTAEQRGAALRDLLDSGSTQKILVEGLTAGPGDEVLQWITRLLVEALDVDLAFVAELGGEQWERLHTLAVATRQGVADNFDYDVRDGPCGLVIGQRTSCVWERLREQFPEAGHFARLGVDAYAGTPLVDSADRSLGLLGVLSAKPISDPDLACATLELFERRITAELEHRRALRELHLIIEPDWQAAHAHPLLIWQTAEEPRLLFWLRASDFGPQALLRAGVTGCSFSLLSKSF